MISPVRAVRPWSTGWWRVLSSPLAGLRGETVDGIGHVIAATSAEYEPGRCVYSERFPRGARRLGAVQANDEVLVRVVVPPDVLDRARQAINPPGHGLIKTMRRHPLDAYFALTFAVSWGYWLPVAIAGGPWRHFPA